MLSTIKRINKRQGPYRSFDRYDPCFFSQVIFASNALHKFKIILLGFPENLLGLLRVQLPEIKLIKL